MITKLSSPLTLKGKSGKEYSFKLITFDNWDDVKDGFTGHGLYLFTKRNVERKHDLIYLGMATDLETRFDGHHKKNCIIKHGANCLGVYQMNNSTKETRKAAESDLLAAFSFPCNDQEN
jgi:predicted GIY-YIG superfamily endonuclease